MVPTWSQAETTPGRYRSRTNINRKVASSSSSGVIHQHLIFFSNIDSCKMDNVRRPTSAAEAAVAITRLALAQQREAIQLEERRHLDSLAAQEASSARTSDTAVPRPLDTHYDRPTPAPLSPSSSASDFSSSTYVPDSHPLPSTSPGSDFSSSTYEPDSQDHSLDATGFREMMEYRAPYENHIKSKSSSALSTLIIRHISESLHLGVSRNSVRVRDLLRWPSPTLPDFVWNLEYARWPELARLVIATVKSFFQDLGFRVTVFRIAGTDSPATDFLHRGHHATIPLVGARDLILGHLAFTYCLEV